MRLFASQLHQQHNPPHEFLEGRLIPFTEVPERAEIIWRALEGSGFGALEAPPEYGLAPILAIHTAEYVDHLRTIYPRYVAAGGAPEAALPCTLPGRRMQRRSATPLAEVGWFAFDLSAPVVAGTYQAAVASAYCAVAAADALLDGELLTYALCRPPGHHAYADLMGGFCYFNNAAIAAQRLLDAGRGWQRIALLDIDVHHGNGTQDIFYQRNDVLFISIHGSPDWEYPYFAGFADEQGAGPGLGYTCNFPLHQGVTDAEYLATLDLAIQQIQTYQPDALVVSAGFDTFAGDPLGRFQLSAGCYPAIGARLAQLGLPTVVVQEGGYTVAALGSNLVGLLRGWQ